MIFFYRSAVTVHLNFAGLVPQTQSRRLVRWTRSRPLRGTQITAVPPVPADVISTPTSHRRVLSFTSPPVKVKVNVHTLDIEPLRSESPPQRSGSL